MSTRGAPLVGSGKSVTPCSRMHWANLRARLLLLGAPLAAREPRWLQVLARADGLLERRAARVQRRAVHHPVDGQLARRVRVRERADPVGAHALGELHRLLTGGARGAGAAGSAGLGRCVRTTARGDQATRARAASGRAFYSCVTSARGVVRLTARYCGAVHDRRCGRPWRRRPRDPPRSGRGRAGPTRPR